MSEIYYNTPPKGVTSQATSVAIPQLVQFARAGSSPWNTSRTVTAGNLIVVAIGGSGNGTYTISDNLSTTYNALPKQYNNGGPNGATTYMWWGIVQRTGVITFTAGGTLPILALGGNIGNNPGGCIYFAEIANADPNNPIISSAGTVATGSSISVNLTTVANSMCFAVTAMAWLNVGPYSVSNPVAMLEWSTLGSGFFILAGASAGTTSFTVSMGSGFPPQAMVALAIQPTTLATPTKTASTISIVQSGTGTATPWSTGLTVTQGNLLIAAHSGQTSGTSSINDNLGCVWHQIDTIYYNAASAGCTVYMWWAIAPVSGAITITQTGTFPVANAYANAGGQLYLAEISGADPIAPIMSYQSGGSPLSLWTPTGSLLIGSAAMCWMNVGLWHDTNMTELQSFTLVSVLGYNAIGSTAITSAGFYVNEGAPVGCLFAVIRPAQTNTANPITCTIASPICSTNQTMIVTSPGILNSGFRVIVGSEIMSITDGGTTTMWTVARGMENTISVGHLAGEFVVPVFSAGSFDALRSTWNGYGTFANRPSSGMKYGDKYKCTDSPYEFVYDGSQWQGWYRGVGNIIPPPAMSTLLYNNAGVSGATTISTVSNTTGEMLISTASDPVGNNACDIRAFYKAYPATPLTFTIGFMVNGPTQNYYRVGIIVSDGTKAALFVNTMFMNYTGASVFGYEQWSNTYNAANNNSNLNSQTFTNYGFDPTNNPMFMTLNDTGSNLVCYLSNDSYNLTQTQVYSVGRTAYLTPAYIGVCVFATGNTAVTGQLVRLFHWSGI